MKYAVDEIIDEIAIIENIETEEKKEVSIKVLPKNIKEGNVVVENITYKLDTKEEEIRRKIIKDKLERLKKLK
ncbi:MAG: DUF3006 family protein [Bacilli bacterium]|nr:DUF3006 family protein [Bacilli bacterium]